MDGALGQQSWPWTGAEAAPAAAAASASTLINSRRLSAFDSMMLRGVAVGSGWEEAPASAAEAAAAANRAAAAAGALQWAEWLPDGSGICAVFEAGLLRFFATPEALCAGGSLCSFGLGHSGTETAAAAATPLSPWLELSEGDCVRALAFPPQLDWSLADKCCCAVAAVDHPIQVRCLWDGRLLTTLRCMDTTEEFRDSFSLTFLEQDPLLLLAATKGALCLFSLSVPDRPLQEWQLAPRLSKEPLALKGLVSALAAAPKSSSSSSSSGRVRVACGSQAGIVCLFDPRSRTRQAAATDLQMQPGAVTQVLPGNQDGSLSSFSLLEGIQMHHYPPPAAIISSSSNSGSNLLWPAAEALNLSSSSSEEETDCPLVSAAFHPELPLLLTAHSKRTFYVAEELDCCSPAAAAARSGVLFQWALGLWGTATDTS
ncbi:hypothetical protein Esti_005620 [Eimeria stiedai]